MLCVLCAQGRTRYGPLRAHTSMADLGCSVFLPLGLLLCPLLNEDNLNRLGSRRELGEGLAAPDETAHGPELMFWTLGAGHKTMCTKQGWARSAT